MSAYSDWRHGALTDEEYKDAATWEYRYDHDCEEPDRDPDDWEDEEW